MTQKWSAKPKEDRAARVRENQRRHRARTKAYIADLEQQLAETKRKLQETLSRNKELEAQVESLHKGGALPSPAVSGHELPYNAEMLDYTPKNDTPADVGASSPPPDSTHDVASMLLALGEEHFLPPTITQPTVPSSSECATPVCAPPVCTSSCQQAIESNRSQPLSGLSEPTTPCDLNDGNVNPVSLACDISAESSTLSQPADPDCSHLPPPRPGESTIHCKAAYSIIKERNFKGMEVDQIRSWLGPGFRRAIIQGEGCRVDSHLVFALIDKISNDE